MATSRKDSLLDPAVVTFKKFKGCASFPALPKRFEML
jgi:hypothetical protein